jgi:hypothetical protein
MNSFNLKAAIRAGVVLAAFLPAIAPAAPAPAAPAMKEATRQTDARTVAELQAAVKATSIVVKGRSYPALKSAAKAASSSCQLGSTMAFNQAAQVDIEGGTHKSSSQTWGPNEQVYSPPNPDYVIQSFNRTITTAGGTYTAGTSQMPPNYSFTNSVNYSSASNSLHNYVLSLNIPGVVQGNLNAMINSALSNYQSYSQSLGASSGTVKHQAQVWGTGVYNTQVGHSWYHGYIDGTLICAPAYLHDQNTLETAMKAWVDDVIRRMPHQIEAPKTTL